MKRRELSELELEQMFGNLLRAGVIIAAAGVGRLRLLPLVTLWVINGHEFTRSCIRAGGWRSLWSARSLP
jgi:hypothetical protein